MKELIEIQKLYPDADEITKKIKVYKENPRQIGNLIKRLINFGDIKWIIDEKEVKFFVSPNLHEIKKEDSHCCVGLNLKEVDQGEFLIGGTTQWLIILAEHLLDNEEELYGVALHNLLEEFLKDYLVKLKFFYKDTPEWDALTSSTYHDWKTVFHELRLSKYLGYSQAKKEGLAFKFFTYTLIVNNFNNQHGKIVSRALVSIVPGIEFEILMRVLYKYNEVRGFSNEISSLYGKYGHRIAEIKGKDADGNDIIEIDAGKALKAMSEGERKRFVKMAEEVIKVYEYMYLKSWLFGPETTHDFDSRAFLTDKELEVIKKALISEGKAELSRDELIAAILEMIIKNEN